MTILRLLCELMFFQPDITLYLVTSDDDICLRLPRETAKYDYTVERGFGKGLSVQLVTISTWLYNIYFVSTVMGEAVFDLASKYSVLSSEVGIAIVFFESANR
jgi:hypothetical protein